MRLYSHFSPRAIRAALVLMFGLMGVVARSEAACEPVASGAVSWWSFDGDFSDLLGANPANAVGTAAFATGKVDNAVTVGDSSYVRVASSASLDVGAGNGMTIEGWFKPASADALSPLIEWGTTEANLGVHLWLSQFSSGDLFANVISADNAAHYVVAPAGSVSSSDWYHVALSYERGSGIAAIYLNGSQVAQQTIGSFALRTSGDLLLGRRIAGGTRVFNGAMDEWALYARALSTAEIQAIFQAGSAGKCKTPVAPSLVTPPASQSARLGQNVHFSVVAKGTQPLTYQWYKDVDMLADATNSTLTLPSVPLTAAGPYSVVVANAAGAVTSEVAVLTVNLSNCEPAPTGLVSWWPFDESLADIAGTNPATASSAPAYIAGAVDGGIYLDGSNDIRVPASESLDVGLGNGLTLEGWIKPDSAFAQRPLVEFGSPNNLGIHLWVSQSFNGDLFANLIDTGNHSHHIFTPGGVVTNSAWYHVALTYDKPSGKASIYVNGSLKAQQSFGSLSLNTAPPLLFGQRVSGGNTRFVGGMDEWALYQRALTSGEIHAIYQAAGDGKCKTPTAPHIFANPQGLTVAVGTDATFNVGASGTRPLLYQWYFNEQPIEGANSNVLTLTAVQFAQSGTYSVTVSNELGGEVSSPAQLFVRPPPTEIRIGHPDGISVGVLHLPLIAQAQGSEHELQFSLSATPALVAWHDATLADGLPDGTTLELNTNGLPSGRIGLRIVLPPQATLSAGEHLLGQVNLTILATTAANVDITFGDAPSPRRVLDSSGLELLAVYAGTTAQISPARVEIVAAEGVPAGRVDMLLRLNAGGNENSLAFTLNFDPALLLFAEFGLSSNLPAGTRLLDNIDQAPQGRIGFAIALPPNETFVPGSSDILRISFEASLLTQPRRANFRFGDEITLRTISDPDSHLLAATFVNGFADLTPFSIEADTAPQPDGNRRIDASDWTRMARIVAGLDSVDPAEFQRVDCAPRDTKGNGVISAADYVQAGRYLINKDRWVAVGGPNEPASPEGGGGGKFVAASSRSVLVPSSSAAPGSVVLVPLRLVAQGGENTLGCSLRFDTSVLTYIGASVTGSNVDLTLNDSSAAQGTLGMLVSKSSPNDSFPLGVNDLVLMSFAVSATATGSTEISFGDQPVLRELVDIDARSVPVTFTQGILQIGLPGVERPKLSIARSIGSAVVSWSITATNFDLESATSLSPPNWKKVDGQPFEFGNQRFISVSVGDGNLFFRLHRP